MTPKQRKILRSHIRKLSDIMDDIHDRQYYLMEHLKQAKLETGLPIETLRTVARHYNQQTILDNLEGAIAIKNFYYEVFEETDDVID